jgi:uncharacterized membrane protein
MFFLKEKKSRLTKEQPSTKLYMPLQTFAGSMLSIYIHLVIYTLWITWNEGLLHLKPFDPSFLILATFAAIEAIFLSTFILMSQNLMNEEADKRAELDLQVSLLTEHEVTRIMTMLSAIAKKWVLKI